MRRIKTSLCVSFALALSAIAATGAFASAAGAVKPSRGSAEATHGKRGSAEATHGKETVQFQCEGLGNVEVSVPSNEHSNGAAQIVGEKGHGIPVSFSTTFTDVTKGTVLLTEAHKSGHGHGHPNQKTTLCTATFEATAAEFFSEAGEGLPEGVAPTDIISGTVEVHVIVKK